MSIQLTYKGHVFEGEFRPDPDDENKSTFTGEAICGPHGPNGEHIPGSSLYYEVVE